MGEECGIFVQTKRILTQALYVKEQTDCKPRSDRKPDHNKAVRYNVKQVAECRIRYPADDKKVITGLPRRR